MTQSMPEIADIARHHAADYIPGAESLSRDQLAERITDLAIRTPHTARQLLDETCAEIDQATGGRYAGQMDTLRNMVSEALGLAAGTF